MGGTSDVYDAMRRPMTALLIAPEQLMREAIHRGEKTISIREGRRDYRKGDKLAIFCHIAPWAVLAHITDVQHKTVGELTDQELRDDGFRDQSDFLEQMRRFGARYENMNEDSPVTVIRWRPDASSYWVKHAATYAGEEIDLLEMNG